MRRAPLLIWCAGWLTLVLTIAVYKSCSPRVTVHPPDIPTPAVPVEGSQDAEVAPQATITRVWGERLVNVYWRNVSVYTAACDQGTLDRKTSGNTLRGREPDYPRDQCSIRPIYNQELPIIAIPWRDRHLHEELIRHPDGTMNHRWRIRVVGLDQVGVRRLPCDRVPYRDKAGNLLKQRDRFDAFMHIDRGMASRIGVNLLRVEEWRMGWYEEGE